MTTQNPRPLKKFEAHGAFTELDQLIQLHLCAKDFNLFARRKSESLLAGPNRTNFRGRGVDFEEVRIYQPGDDIRSIDWRVTARTQQPHTKLYREERERPVLVVVDQRRNMFFGSQVAFKSVVAAEVASILAWAGLCHSDKIGGLVFNDTQHQEIRPKRSKQTVLQLINTVHRYNHQLNREQVIQPDSFSKVTEYLRRIAKPGSAIFFISDFEGINEDAQKHLHHLSRHCDIHAVFVFDDMEKNLPKPGQYTVTDGQQRFRLYTGQKALRENYLLRFQQKLKSLQDNLGRLGIPVIPMATHDSVTANLQLYFGKRSLRNRQKAVNLR